MSFQQIRDRADRVRGIPLQAVLLATGATPDHDDKAKWHTSRGILSVTGMKFMNWTRGDGGGGAIDMAIHLNDMGFKDAVEWLWRHFPGPDLTGHDHLPPTPELKLPPPDPSRLARVKRYLIAERGIAPALVAVLVESGKLYADKRANAVFLLLGSGNNSVGAEMRGTGPCPWRGMAPGSRKDLGFFFTHAAQVDATVLCESAIDAVSCFALHPRYRCISTAGARPNPRWLAAIIRQGSQVYCGFDTDAAGESAAQAMILSNPTVKRLRPSRHDWNDVLTSRS